MKKYYLFLLICTLALFLSCCGNSMLKSENWVTIKNIAVNEEVIKDETEEEAFVKTSSLKMARRSARLLADNSDAGIQYVLLYKNQTDIAFTIELDNPEGYGIDALRVTCDDPNSQILMESTWTPIQRESDGTIVVNWSSENPYSKTYQIRTTSEDALNTFKVVDIRLAGHERFQSKETGVENIGNNKLSIFKILDDAYTVETVSNNIGEKTLSVTVNDKNISNLKLNGLAADENGNWTFNESGEVLITYNYTIPEIEKTFLRTDRMNIKTVSTTFIGEVEGRETRIYTIVDVNSIDTRSYCLVIEITIENADSVILFFDGEEYAEYTDFSECQFYPSGYVGYFWNLKDVHNNLIEESFISEKDHRFVNELALTNFMDKIVLRVNGIDYKLVYDIDRADVNDNYCWPKITGLEKL